MAARGSLSKEKITEKLLETFQGSFINGKELRIPMVEDGMPIQIKVTLTAAKDIVETGQDAVVPGEPSVKASTSAFKVSIEPSAEEKQNVSDLLASLGLA